MTAPDISRIQEKILQTLEMKSDTQSLSVAELARLLSVTEIVVKEEAALLWEKKYIEAQDSIYRLTDMGRNLAIHFIKGHAYYLISLLVEYNMVWVELPFSFSLPELIAGLHHWPEAPDFMPWIEKILIEDGVATPTDDGKLALTADAGGEFLRSDSYGDFRFNYLFLGPYPGVVEIIYGEDDDYSAADEVLNRED